MSLTERPSFNKPLGEIMFEGIPSEIVSEYRQQMRKGEIKGNGSVFGDLLINAVVNRIEPQTLKLMQEAISDDLGWKDTNSPAEIKGFSFLNAAERVNRGVQIDEVAQSYHKMFGISVEDATKRIRIAQTRI